MLVAHRSPLNRLLTAGIAALTAQSLTIFSPFDCAAAGKKESSKTTDKRIIGDDVPMQIWRDVTVTPWAVLLCIHGLSLHASSYAPFGRAMAHLGLPTYALDVRGFGSWQNTSEASRLNFDSTFKDIRNALIAVRRVNPGLAVVLIGESMGGALALQATAANPDLVDGLICSVPSRARKGQNTTNIKTALGLIYRPNGDIDVGDKVIKRATQQSDVADEWERDPLTRKNFTAKELLQFHNLMNESRQKAETITKTPVLFLQGGKDKLIKPDGTVILFNHLKTSDKDLVMVGTAEHLILEQGQFDDKVLIKDDVISLLTNWIDKHVANVQEENDSAKTMEINADLTRQARGHYKIAEGHMLLNEPDAAKDHLITVLRMARGTALAQKADQMLLTLPSHLIAPPTDGSRHENAHLLSLNAAKANDKPTVLVFCAPWIESCKNILNDLNTAIGTDASKINVVYIDADKEENLKLLDEYGIKPLPAVLYLNYKNEVVRYTLGDPGPSVMRSRLNTLFDADARLHKEEEERSKNQESSKASP